MDMTRTPADISTSSGFVSETRLRDLLLSIALIGSGPALWHFGTMILAGQPDLQGSYARLQHQHGIDAAETALGLLAAAAGLCVSGATTVAVLAVLAQQLAQRCGAWKLERRLALFSPEFMRRSATLVVAAGLGLSSVAADAWPRSTTTETGQGIGGADSALFDPAGPGEVTRPGPTRPVMTEPGVASETRTASEIRAAHEIPIAHEVSHAPEEDRHPDPERRADSTPPPSGLFTPELPGAERLQGLPQRHTSAPEQIVVRLGDSLWDIAADHLGPDATDWEIAASWPRWHAANRDRIGADPGIILPGMILTVPGS